MDPASLLAQLGQPPAGGPPGPDGNPSPEEMAQMLAFLEMYEKSGAKGGDVPQELSALLRNVKQAKGQATDDVETENITPEPYFVIKTANEAGQKVFINVCGSPKIAAPGNWANGLMPEEVTKALENMDNMDEKDVQALRFPLSCSEPRVDVDKKVRRYLLLWSSA